MNKVFLHIGPHKTGSTFLQRMFVRNREQLSESNIYYPQSGQEFLFGHFNLVHFIKGDESIKGGFKIEDFVKETKTVKNILLSSEDFIRLNVDQLHDLKSIFENREWEIVYYVRNWNDLLPSVWAETIKRGSFLNFKEYIKEEAYKKDDYFNIDHNHNLKKFSAVFGIESIKIFDYDNIIREGSLFKNFLTEVLELDGIDFYEENKQFNVRLPIHMLSYIMLLNKAYFVKNQENAGTELRIRFLDRVKKNPNFMDTIILSKISKNTYKFSLGTMKYIDRINFNSVKYFSKFNLKPSYIDNNRLYDYVEIGNIFNNSKETLIKQCKLIFD